LWRRRWRSRRPVGLTAATARRGGRCARAMRGTSPKYATACYNWLQRATRRWGKGGGWPPPLCRDPRVLLLLVRELSSLQGELCLACPAPRPAAQPLGSCSTASTRTPRSLADPWPLHLGATVCHPHPTFSPHQHTNTHTHMHPSAPPPCPVSCAPPWMPTRRGRRTCTSSCSPATPARTSTPGSAVGPQRMSQVGLGGWRWGGKGPCCGCQTARQRTPAERRPREVGLRSGWCEWGALDPACVASATACLLAPSHHPPPAAPPPHCIPRNTPTHPANLTKHPLSRCSDRPRGRAVPG
jgi:hypothetical protein